MRRVVLRAARRPFFPSFVRTFRRPRLAALPLLLAVLLAACGKGGGAPAGGGGPGGADSDPCLSGCTIVADRAEVQVSDLGGTIDFTPTDGSGTSLVLGVPPGALTGETTLTIVPTSFFPQNPHVLPGSVFSFGPASLTLGAPLDLTIHYDPGAVGALNETKLGLQAVVSGAWLESAGILDSVAHTVAGPMAALAVWGVLDGPVPPDNVVFVDAAATGANDGSSWANAFTTVQAAMAVAVAGQQVWIAAGTHTPASANAVLLNDPLGLPIYGGFAGGEVALSERPNPPLATVLSGDFNGDDDPTDPTVNRTDNSVHVIAVPTAYADLLLDGLVVTGGTAVALSGGGLYAPNATVTLRNVTFSGNTATSGGGASIRRGSVVNSTFSGNTATSAGGIIVGSTYDAYLTVTNSTFTGNSAQWDGGGMLVGSGSNGFLLTVTNATFTGNSAANGGGGGIFVDGTGGASVTLANTILQDNTASQTGGIWVRSLNSGASLSIFGTVMAGNTGGATPNFLIWGNGAQLNPVGSPCTTAITIVPGSNGELFLTPGGACFSAGRDPIADAAFAAAGLDWRAMTTDIAGTLDTSPVNPGRHYVP